MLDNEEVIPIVQYWDEDEQELDPEMEDCSEATYVYAGPDSRGCGWRVKVDTNAPRTMIH